MYEVLKEHLRPGAGHAGLSDRAPGGDDIASFFHCQRLALQKKIAAMLPT